MSSRFDSCLQFTLDWEGRTLEYDPNDPGGVTFAGIDQRDHPGVNVRHLTLEKAAAIYLDEKWLRFKCDQLPMPWDLLVFDSAVNPGQGWVVSALQKAVGATVDNHLGPKTIAAVAQAGVEAIKKFVQLRVDYYNSRSERLKKHFLKGWLARTDALRKHVLGGLE